MVTIVPNPKKKIKINIIYSLNWKTFGIKPPLLSYIHYVHNLNKRNLNIKTEIMTLNELATKLSEMYNNAPKGDSVAMIHLFGIKYAKEIKESEYSKKDIIQQSGINASYLTELTKGVKLAEYVIPKN